MENFVNMPKTKRGMVTLNKIVNSAEKLFYKNGYNRTGISDITKASNVALGTFYIYFEDKLSIYRYLLVQYSHRIRMHIAKEISGVENRCEAERIGLRAFLLFIAKHKHIYNIIWESLYIDKKLFVDYYTQFASNYARQIKQAQEADEMKQYDPEIVAFVMMGISNFIGLNYIMFKDEKNVDQVVDEVIKILKDGLFT